MSVLVPMVVARSDNGEMVSMKTRGAVVNVATIRSLANRFGVRPSVVLALHEIFSLIEDSTGIDAKGRADGSQ